MAARARSVVGWIVTIFLIAGYAACILTAVTSPERTGQVRAIFYRK